MKIEKIFFNNRKKCFELTTSNAANWEFPYSQLRLIPTTNNPIQKVYPDSEIGNEGFTYELERGQQDTILMDDVLEYNKDPEFLKKMLLYKLSIKAQNILKKKRIKKREVIRRLNTSPTQFYRLIDQTNYSKTIDQMIKLLWALDTPIDIVIKKAA